MSTYFRARFIVKTIFNIICLGIGVAFGIAIGIGQPDLWNGHRHTPTHTDDEKRNVEHRMPTAE